MSENETSSERLARLKDRLAETEIQAQCGAAFVNESCLGYAKNLVKDFYTIDNDGTFVTNDKTPLDPRNLQPMPISQLGQWLQEIHPYLFRKEAPSGVSTATTVAPPPPPLNRAEMTLEQKAEFIHQHGGAAFMALPATPTEAKSLTEKRRSEMTVEEKTLIIQKFGSDYYLGLPA